MLKSVLRKKFTAKRSALSAEEIEIRNDKIFQRFKKVNLDSIEYLHTFLPLTNKNEVNTYPIINYIRSQFPNIKLVLSSADFATSKLRHHVWDDSTVLQKNRWGIEEPVNARIILPDSIDFVLIPLLAFDTRGFRVGYGKGFYDIFLSECKADVFKVGLSHFGPVDHIEDINEFDVAMDLCITPEKTYTF